MAVKEDIMGIPLKEGDIVIRPKYSNFCFHKILKITEKGFVLSTRRIQYSNSRTSYVRDSTNIKQVKEHEDSIYVSSYTNLLIVK